MKKKIFVLTLFASMLLLIYCNDVQAVEIKTSDVPNNTYIIGTHMFSSEVVLTTKHIMLGATTIESDKLSDMTIYYKTPRGVWIDGLSGDTVDVPTKFDVDYVDLVLQVSTPVISSSKEISDTEDLHGKKYSLVLDNIDNMTGVELYSANKEDGEYKKVKDLKIDEITNNSIEVEVKGGYIYFFKVKTYKTVSDTKYSEFSNVVNIDNSLQYSDFGGVSGGHIPEEGEDQTHDRALYFHVDDFITKLGNRPDGIEIYFSLEKDGEYTLIDDIAYDDLLVLEGNSVVPEGYLGFSYAAIPGYTNYLKIRSYIKYENETVYSEFGYATKNEDLDTPWISKAQGLAVENDLYPIELYLDRVYPDFRVRPVGVEVYYSTEENGEYTLLTSVVLTEMRRSEGKYIAKINVPLNNKYYIKVRNYAEVKGEKVFGEFSNIQATNAIYQITYNLDGGSNIYQEGKYTPSYYLAGTSEINIAQPKKEGYVFIGWTGSNGDTPEMDVAITKETTGKLEFTAHWAMLGDLNGDNVINTTDNIALLKYLSNNNSDLDDKIIKNIESGLADVNSDGTIDYIDLDVMGGFETGWCEKLPYASGTKYTITYNLDGGSYEGRTVYTEFSLQLYNGRPLIKTIPKKEGYVFMGWTGSSGNTPQREIIVSMGTTGNLEYTANWIPLDTIIGDVNASGSVNSEDADAVLNYHVGLGSDDITFLEAGDVNQDGTVDAVDADIIKMYADKTISTLPYDSGKKYTISYNLNGGVSKDRKVYSTISGFELKKPTKEGYAFVGWTGSNGDNPELNVTVSKGTTGDLSYIANWTLYGDVNNDGYIDKTDADLLYQYDLGKETPELNMLAADVSLDGKVNAIDAELIEYYVKAGNNGTLIFEIKECDTGTITYNLDGGTDLNRRVYSIVSDFVLEQPTKEGYIFIGWTGSNGDTPDKEVRILGANTKGDLSYTANWQKE